MAFSLSTTAPRRTPLAACLAVVLGSAAIFATTSDANAAWQHKHDFKHRTHEQALALTGKKPHSNARANFDHPALQAHLRAKFGAHMAAIPSRPNATTAVTSCADSGAGTLRDAVATASSGDTIDLSGLACSTITLTTGAIATGLDDLTINGPGAANLTIDASGNDRAFVHYGNGTFTLNKVTVANGSYDNYAYSGGGCILALGSALNLNNSVVTGCQAGTAYFGYDYAVAEGGAIYSAGAATLTNSTVSNSSTYAYGYYGGAVSVGGGLYSKGPATLTNSTLTGNGAYGYKYNTDLYSFIRGGGFYGRAGVSITGSTIDNNYAYFGGAGVGSVDGATTITNSTIADNYSFIGYGGGIFTLFGPTTISNSTVSGNYSFFGGGGLYSVYTALDLESTLIASNTSGIDSANSDFGYFGGSGYAPTGANNLIVSSTYAVPSGTITTDPNLQALANNGGPTRTMALITGSSAIDTGNNVAGLATDQRGTGFARVGGTSADIGAFELQVAAAPAEERIPAPTLSTWAQWLLAGAMGLLGLGGFLRRKHPSSESS
jgi:hypothetical protein